MTFLYTINNLIYSYYSIMHSKFIKTKIIFYKNGSYGAIYRDNNYIYKITFLTDLIEINETNLNELIFLNYFRINFKEYYNKENNNDYNYLPIQNEKTDIMNYINFLELYEISNNDLKKLELIKGSKINDDDYIIINKMLFFNNTFEDYIKDIIYNNNLDFDKLKYIINSLLKGLNLFHQNNLLHGDLKPPNIIEDNHLIKIIDLGGIKFINSNYYNCSCTITYRSPEEINYECNFQRFINSCKSDIWSLGLIYYEILNKKNPIYDLWYNFRYNENINNEEIIAEKLNTIYENNSFIEHKDINYENIDNNSNDIINLKKIIKNMLHINHKNRISSINDIYYAFNNKNIDTLQLKYNNFDFNLFSNNELQKFIYFRKKYKIYIEFLSKKYNFLLPLMINIIDRYYLNLYKSNIIKYIINQEDFELHLIFICSFILVNCLLYKFCFKINKIIKLFNDIYQLEDNLGTKNTIILKLINIIEVLNYDIIRNNLIFYNNKNSYNEDIKFIFDNIINFDIILIKDFY